MTTEDTEQAPDAPTPEHHFETVAVPDKPDLDFLLYALNTYPRARFEYWARSHWANAAGNYERERRELRTLERLGIPDGNLADKRERLRMWGAQISEAQFLAAANFDDEEPGLDYGDPLTVKYFALWLWATSGNHGILADERPTDEGPLDFRAILDDDLLALPGFGLD